MLRLGMSLSLASMGDSISAPPGPPTFVNVSTGAAASDSTSAVKPVGLVEGDQMVAFVAHDGGDAPTITGGTGGWTAVTPTVNGTGITARVFKRTAGASEPGFYSLLDLGGVAAHIRGTIVAYRPAAGTTLTVTANAQGNPSGTVQTTPSIAPSVENTMLLVAGVASAGKSWTPPAGMTERSDQGTQMTVGVFDLVLESVDGEDITKTAVLSSASPVVMAIVALAPA